VVDEKLLTIRDVSLILHISEKEVIELAESQTLPAYRIGGVYLRFKRQQIEEFKKKIKSLGQGNKPAEKDSFAGAVSDFFYFNDFYILSVLIVSLLSIIIFRGY